jgi:hypothetical protein
MNTLKNVNDKCKQFRRLRINLIEEIRSLKESLALEEREGVANPLETVSIIKSLQEALSTVELELEKCPEDA